MWREEMAGEGGAVPAQEQGWLTQQAVSRAPQDQSAVSFWDRAPCPPALLPELTDLPAGTRLYAVIDGTRRKALRGTNDLSLWQGSLMAEPLLLLDGQPEPTGPWLLDLSAEDEEGARFLTGFFADTEVPLTGILLKSTAGRDEVRAHLRGLMRVVRGSSGETFLRWWDPVTAIALLESSTARTQIDRLCFTRSGAALVWLAAAPDLMMRIFTPKTGPEHSGQARLPLQLDPVNEVALAGTKWGGLQASLGQWLAESYPELALTTPEARARASAHLVTVGRGYGFTLKDEFAYLGHVMAWLGGWFHQTGAFPALDQILVARDMRRRQKPMRAALQSDWAGSWLKPLAAVREAVLASPEVGPALTDAEASALLGRHLSDADRPRALNFYWFAARDAQARGLPSDLLPFVAFASLFLGYRYFDDPFRTGAPNSDRNWHETCRIDTSRLKEFRHG